MVVCFLKAEAGNGKWEMCFFPALFTELFIREILYLLFHKSLRKFPSRHCSDAIGLFMEHRTCVTNGIYQSLSQGDGHKAEWKQRE